MEDKILNFLTALFEFKGFKTITAWIIAIVFVLTLMYSCFWLAKHGSYMLFYEDMVRETIKEIVNEGALK